MCNINTLFIKNKLKNTTQFMMAVSSHSFETNKDGEGIYISSTDTVHKSRDKINLFEFKNEIEKSNVLISHQRLSTSGFELEYNHPFENENFVMVHNGVINQFKNGTGSDTFGFWSKFNEEFNSITSHLSRENKVKRVIKKLFKVDSGSYSILIHDRKTKNSFYFRGTGYPPIHFFENDQCLFITTNEHNGTFLNMLTNKEFTELEINGRTIYKITKAFKVYEIAKLPKEKINYSLLDYKSEQQQSQLSSFAGYTCVDCNKQIHDIVYEQDSEKLCDDCWKFRFENNMLEETQ